MDDADFEAETFDKSGFVGRVDTVFLGAGEGVLQELCLEHLGSLSKDDALARNGSGDESDIFRQTGALHFLDCVHRGNAEYGGFAATRFFDDAGNVFDSNERADSVVDDDEFGVFGYVSEGLSNGGLAGVAALHNMHRLCEAFLLNAGIEAFDVLCAGGNDDLGDERTGSDAAEAQDHERNAIELEELLRGLVAHARAETCSSENCDDLSHRN